MIAELEILIIEAAEEYLPEMEAHWALPVELQAGVCH